ncbi:fimbrial protein [Providencia manganoxydans]
MMRIHRQLIKKGFTTIFFMLTVNGVSYSEPRTTLYFSGKVENTTCEFDASSEQNIVFDESFNISVLSELAPGVESIYNKSFSIKYSCDVVSSTDEPPVFLGIATLGNTKINKNTLFEDQSINVGFLLLNCGASSNNSCTEINFNGSSSTIEVTSGENFFKVTAVKIEDKPITTGDINAAIEISFIQP